MYSLEVAYMRSKTIIIKEKSVTHYKIKNVEFGVINDASLYMDL